MANKNLQNLLSELAHLEIEQIKNTQPKPKYVYIFKKEATPDFNRAICKGLEVEEMFIFLASAEPYKPTEGHIDMQGPEEHCNELGKH